MMLIRFVRPLGFSLLLPLGADANSANRHTIVNAMLCDREICSNVTLRVWDGDSFIIHDRTGGREKIRIENIDAPEIGGPCVAERVAALRAKDDLASRLSDHKIELVRSDLDRYGRQLARVSYRAHETGTFAFADELAAKRRELEEVEEALAAEARATAEPAPQAA